MIKAMAERTLLAGASRDLRGRFDMIKNEVAKVGATKIRRYLREKAKQFAHKKKV